MKFDDFVEAVRRSGGHVGSRSEKDLSEHFASLAVGLSSVFAIFSGDRFMKVDRYESSAKATARMWRDHDKIPDVRIKRVDLP